MPITPIELVRENQARIHVRNDDQPYSSATNAMEAWPETAEVFGAISHGPGRLWPAVTGRNRPEAAHRERQQSAKSRHSNR
ncbi:nucleotidyltransferase family protein [Pseudomonas amygdali]|uniref:nucleotidyltransferase family protein n=1 Tax=Pseudomonas amygdali TaxID=47877 RepID=UPI003531247A